MFNKSVRCLSDLSRLIITFLLLTHFIIKLFFFTSIALARVDFNEWVKFNPIVIFLSCFALSVGYLVLKRILFMITSKTLK